MAEQDLQDHERRQLDTFKAMVRGGRPRKYETSEALTEAVIAYFEGTPRPLWTVAGMAQHLGFANHRTLHQAKKLGEQFEYVIDSAIGLIGVRREELVDGVPSLLGLALKTHHEYTEDGQAAITPPPVHIHLSGQPDGASS